MKVGYAAILFLLLLAGCATPSKSLPPTRSSSGGDSIAIPQGRWVACEEQEAEYAIYGACSLDRIFTNSPIVQFLKSEPVMVERNPDGSARYSVTSCTLTSVTNVDGVMENGQGCGYNMSVRFAQPIQVDPTNEFELNVAIHWDYGKDTGEYQKSFSFRPLKKGTIEDGRFRALFRVTKGRAYKGTQSTK